MTGARIVPCGDDALRLVTCASDDRHLIADVLRNSGSWREVVVGRESVTVQFDPLDLPPPAARDLLENTVSVGLSGQQAVQPVVTLTVNAEEASAPDLSGCAEANGCTIEEFLSRLHHSRLRVDMLGFAPGFAYVSGVDQSLRGGRLENPRQRVPAGSIGFIEGYLGIYALEGPGGWPIIGRTNAILFDKSAPDPFLLSAGTRLQIEWA
ncbi:carboxyltransferase domain-containing protein [Hyphomonas sp.]|jgi:allophanate hydrolase|uniref:5-oxoprolinase subunit B family protein n=1 Tax=Hyphomonas sp. TaxID=87 RepID=UPI0032D9894A